MADATPAPREPNRSRPERPERPEAALARAMVATEYGLSEAYRRRAQGPTLTARLMEMLRDGWTVLMEALGASRSRQVAQPPPAPGRMEADLPAGPPQGVAAPAPVPVQWAPPAGPEEAAFREMARLQALAGQLSTRRYEAFEDAVLHLVRSDDKLRKTYEESPETIPAIARYAANAQTRELLREGDGGRARGERRDPEVRTAPDRTALERFERPAPPSTPAREQREQRDQQARQERRREASPEPPREPRLRDMGDGQRLSYDAHAFAAAQDAERARREEVPGWEVPSATQDSPPQNRGGELAYDALPFAVAAEERRARREQSTERDGTERRDGREAPATPPDPQRTASPEPVSPLSPSSPVSSLGFDRPTDAVRPVSPASSALVEPPRALLGERGLRAARDGFESRDGQSPRRAADPPAAKVHRPAPAPTAQGPTR
ncbi:hypothetical protein [Streptomyces sp. NPDC001508]|uniref:hypothetical protein n=1 Tax=Streptomyces sp. NPDC001508 TaxID=3154656 RepID=UPI00332A8E3F